MSRIGKKPIELPSGVSAAVSGQTIEVKGPKGVRSFTASDDVTLAVEEGQEVVAETEENTEDTIVETPEVSVDQDLAALFGGEELSEEFQEKAKTIFEAALAAKVSEVQETLAAEYEKALSENLVSVKEELVERLDAYLEYVADEWVSENELAIEHGLKTEMTESFLEGMKKLFEDHYVTIPEEKYDVIESMVDKLDEMESKLNEQIDKNVALNKRLAESTADVIFSEVTEGLAQTQRDKLATLAENVEFESENGYREKLETLKESYFPSKTSTPNSKSENLTEESEATDYQSKSVSSTMERYLQTMTRVAKK